MLAGLRLKSCGIKVDAQCHSFYLCVTKHDRNQVVSAGIQRRNNVSAVFEPEAEQVMVVRAATQLQGKQQRAW